jgi:hypothetical protein
MRLGRLAVFAIGIAAAACSPTIGPVVPSVQVIVVLDSLEADDMLRIIPVDSPGVVHTVKLNYDKSIALFDKHALALNGSLGVASHGGSVVLFDVVTGTAICDKQFVQSGGIASLIFTDPSTVYVASYGSNVIYNFNTTPGSCAGEGSSQIRGIPRAFVMARGHLFAIARNGEDPGSWLSTIGQPPGPLPLPSEDSIPLSPPGHSEGAVLGSDGNVYVINAGVGSQNARISQINPVERTELNVIPGFGTQPRFIATDGADRIFVASAAEGLMVYNLRTNRVERDAQSAIPLGGAPRGLITDDVGRVYVLTAGSCHTAPDQPGKVQVFGTDLVPTRVINVGTCPVAIAVTDIPATLYHFEH